MHVRIVVFSSQIHTQWVCLHSEIQHTFISVVFRTQDNNQKIKNNNQATKQSNKNSQNPTPSKVELTDEVKEVRQSMRNVLVVCKQMHEKINKCIQEDVAEQKRKKDMRILQIVGEFSGELSKKGVAGMGIGGDDVGGSVGKE